MKKSEQNKHPKPVRRDMLHVCRRGEWKPFGLLARSALLGVIAIMPIQPGHATIQLGLTANEQIDRVFQDPEGRETSPKEFESRNLEFQEQGQLQVEDLQDIEQRLKNRTAEEARLNKEAEDKAQQVKALRYQMIEMANSIQDSEREIARIERELERLAAEEEEAAGKLAREEGNLSEILAALQAFELSRPPALLVSPEDANQAARAALLLSEAAPALAEKAKVLRDIVEQLSVTRIGLADQRANYERTAAGLEARRQILSELLIRREEERDVAQRLAAAAQKETAALAAQATSLKGVVDQLQRLAHSVTPRLKPIRKNPNPVVSDVIADNGAGRADPSRGIEIIDGSASETNSEDIESSDIASLGRSSIKALPSPTPFSPARSFLGARGALRPPVVGRVVGRFGQLTADGERLDGVRIEVRDQAIVTAPYEARVVFAQRWGPIGNMVVLDVGGGYHILLMGVGRFLVDVGQTVNAGEPLAEMTAQTSSLDLQIRKNGEPVNPAQWLSAKTVEEMAF